MASATDTQDRHNIRLAIEVTDTEAAARTGVPSVDELDETLRLWGVEPRRCSDVGRIDLASIVAEHYGDYPTASPEILATGSF